MTSISRHLFMSSTNPARISQIRGSVVAEDPFTINWVLVNELAIGTAPCTESHLDLLTEQGIRAVFSLCSSLEMPPPKDLHQRFVCERLVLPDHRSGRMPELAEIEAALDVLSRLLGHGSVYVHCVAAIERSPLLCLCWLVKHYRQSPQSALDYMMQVHPLTNPLPGQLMLVSELYRLHQEPHS